MNKPHLWQIYTNVRYFSMVYSITELRIIKQRTFVHREATHVHIYWQNKAFLESIGVCRLSLTILALLYPTLPLSHFVPSFSGGVSNGRASSRLWTISSSCYILGVTWLRLPLSRLLTLFSSSFQGIAQASLVPVLASFASCSLLQTTISMSLNMYTGQL